MTGKRRTTSERSRKNERAGRIDLPRAGLTRNLRDGVATVDAEVGAGDIVGGIRQQEGHGAHKVLGRAHLALGDERGPLLLEVRVVVEDLLGAVVGGVEMWSAFQSLQTSLGLGGGGWADWKLEEEKDLQGCEHVSGGDAVDADAEVSPLDGQGRGHVADGRLGRVVRPSCCTIWSAHYPRVSHVSFLHPSSSFLAQNPGDGLASGVSAEALRNSYGLL